MIDSIAREAKKIIKKLSVSFDIGVTDEEIEAIVKELNPRKPMMNASEIGTALRMVLSKKV